jgi:site-specific DNA-methyltransferase (adenine-specific)
MKIEWVSPQALTPYPQNAKKHPPEQIDHIANSIKQFGWQQPIVVDKNKVVIIGHGRLYAARQLMLDSVPVVFAENLTDDQVKALRLADNQTAISEYDFSLLEQELAALDIAGVDMSMFGFEVGEDFEDHSQIQEDEIPDLPDEPIAKIGQIFQLGDHRLMCGDSTSLKDVKNLMGGGKASLVFTDPPYNIAGESKNFAADCSKAMDELSKAEWDVDFNIKTVFPVLFDVMAEDITVYICTSHFLAPDIWEWMKGWASHYSYCIWAKPNPMPSLSKRHWTWNTELICYATRGKHTFNFPSEGHALSTWTISKLNGKTGHPTEKPVEVPATAISHSSKRGDLCLDLFGGSGSTLIACEQLGRKCFMMELDPHYVDVIIQRWENLTGQKAVLLNG